MASRYELEQKLKELNEKKIIFLNNKNSVLNSIKSNYLNSNLDLDSDLTEVNQEIKMLETCVESSVELSKLIIDPIISKQKIITNLKNTLELLEIDRSISEKLEILKKEHSLEKKIEIILSANKLIEQDFKLFDVYRESFIKESQDVLNSLESKINVQRDSLESILNSISVSTNFKVKKEEILIEIEKYSILLFKLTNKESVLKLLTKYISFSFKKVDIKSNNTTNTNTNNTANKLEEALEKHNDSIAFIVKSYIGYINKKISFYCKDLSWNLYHISLILNGLIDNIFIVINEKSKEIIKTIDSFDSQLKKVYSVNNKDENTSALISQFDKLCKINNYSESSDILISFDSQCQNLVSCISNLVVLKFFCLCTHLKIKYAELSKEENNNNNTNLEDEKKIRNSVIINSSIVNEKHIQNKKIRQLEDTFRPFDNLVYELGSKYLNTEIGFIKLNLISIFYQDSKKSLDLEALLHKGYFELINETLSSIDDYYYTLKIAGNRAIDTYNLQYCLTIFNIIKDIIQSDIIEILDNKFGLILKKKFSSYNSKYSNLSYYPSHSEPTLSSKFTKSNLYLIICMNTIIQCLENSNILLEEAKRSILKTYFTNKNSNSNLNDVERISNERKSVFDETKILNQFDSIINPGKKELFNEELTLNAFKQCDKDLVNYTFQDLENINKQYDSFLTEKIKSLIEDHLINYIKSSVDLLNQINYNIDGKNSLNAELAESFSAKFVEETDIILNQWKTQMHETCFNKFISTYCFYITIMIENAIMLKKFSSYGVVILEKDLNKIINFFNTKTSISIRDQFSRLLSIVNILNLENQHEVDQFMKDSNDCKLPKSEIERILKLKF